MQKSKQSHAFMTKRLQKLWESPRLGKFASWCTVEAEDLGTKSHQVAFCAIFLDYIDLMKGAMERDNISIPDSQLACARINSREGQEYIRAMNAAANYAYCNRSILTFFIRKVGRP